MPFLALKPVSANTMYEYSGSPRKSQPYLAFESNAKRMLKHKPLRLPSSGALKFTAVFGVSGKFDLDNALKPFIDILQDVYGFDDKRIAEIHVKKVSTRRKEEFIEFDIKPV